MKKIVALFSLLFCFSAVVYSAPKYVTFNRYISSYAKGQVYCKLDFSRAGLQLIKKYFKNPVSICNEDKQLNTPELCEAYKHYLSMAKKGTDDGQAAYLVGMANLLNLGVQNNTVYTEALKWLKKSANLGYPPGIARYADVRQAAKSKTMKLFNKYYALRLDAYRKVARKGFAMGYVFLINHYMHKNNTKMVSYWLNQAKLAGVGNNPLILALEAESLFQEPTISQALDLLKRALASKNNSIGAVKRMLAGLGGFYATSKKYKDMNKALEYYRQAALLNDGFAQNQLGNMFYSGLMVKKNLKTANYWYCQAEKNVYMPTHSCKK